jgi:hypothetical protein
VRFGVSQTTSQLCPSRVGCGETRSRRGPAAAQGHAGGLRPPEKAVRGSYAGRRCTREARSPARRVHLATASPRGGVIRAVALFCGSNNRAEAPSWAASVRTYGVAGAVATGLLAEDGCRLATSTPASTAMSNTRREVLRYRVGFVGPQSVAYGESHPLRIRATLAARRSYTPSQWAQSHTRGRASLDALSPL